MTTPSTYNGQENTTEATLFVALELSEKNVTVHLMKTGITPQLVIASHRQEGETGPLRHAGRLHGRR